MKKVLSSLFCLFTVLSIAACTKEKVIERQAPPDVKQSFSVSGTLLQIKKSSLNKTFLLMTSGKTGGHTPQWVDIKPQVVSFEKDASGKKLALLEENYDSVYTEIQTDNLLTTFDIVKEDSDFITFEWGQGLRSVAYVDVFDIDTKDPEAAPKAEEDASKEVMPIIDSYVKSLNFDTNNNLEINQISKIRVNKVTPAEAEGAPAKYETREETLALNLQIRPYKLASKDFFAKESDTSRRVGFFVTKLKTKGMSNGTRNLITKWDVSADREPIMFLISDAVPAQYVQAVSEGALYWNKVFGRDVVVVKTNVDIQATPQNRTVMIRWIPWLDSGAAYAQAQSDPLTGEILRGQIFMPSAFTRIGSADLLITNNGSPVRKPVMNNTSGCDLEHKVMSMSLLAAEASDSERLRLAQDSVRITVAHELGHVFGLRHNFAGSFSAKVSNDEIYSSAKNYLKEPNHQGLETSTSIMDYSGGVDEILASAYIKHSPLSYDKMAMDWANAKNNDEVLNESISKYCSDEDIAFANAKNKQIYGCERFDGGNNPLERKYLDIKLDKNSLVNVLFIAILNRMYPPESGKASVDDVFKQVTARWKVLGEESATYLSGLLLNKSEFISWENAKTHVGTDYDAQDAALNMKLKTDLAAVGGYSEVLNGLLRNGNSVIDTRWVADQVHSLRTNPKFKQGQTLAGRNYSFSNEEEAKIVQFFSEVTGLNKKTLFNVTGLLVPKTGNILNADTLQLGEAKVLAMIWVDLNEASESLLDLKVGADLATLVQVPEKFLTAAERIKYLSLVSAKLLSSSDNQENVKFAADSLRTAMNKVILAADPLAAIQTGTLADYKAAITDLDQRKLIDAKALNWLSGELQVFSQLIDVN